MIKRLDLKLEVNCKPDGGPRFDRLFGVGQLRLQTRSWFPRSVLSAMV